MQQRRSKRIKLSKYKYGHYGRYSGHARHHLDQVPLEFGQYGTHSYNDKGKGECWNTGSKVDISKRQCTLQVFFRGLAQRNASLNF